MDERAELIQILRTMTEAQWKWFLSAAAGLFTRPAMEKAVEQGTVGQVNALYQATNALASSAERAGLPEAATAYGEARTAIRQAVEQLEAIPA